MHMSSFTSSFAFFYIFCDMFCSKSKQLLTDVSLWRGLYTSTIGGNVGSVLFPGMTVVPFSNLVGGISINLLLDLDSPHAWRLLCKKWYVCSPT